MKMYENVLRRARALEEKKGIRYTKVDEGMYNTFKLLLTLASIWSLFMNGLFVLARHVNYSGTAIIDSINSQNLTVSVFSVIIIACLVMLRLKFLRKWKFFNEVSVHIISAILITISSVCLLFLFADLSRDELGFLGVKTFFYFRHLAPLALMSFFVICMAIIAIHASYKTNKMYNKVLADLYESFKKENDENSITDEKWEEFLKNYNPDEKQDEKSKKRSKIKVFVDDEKDSK